MSKTKLRIVQDFINFNNNKPEGIYLHINEENIFHNYALIIGPKNTPYFGGFYLFEIKFPRNYPEKNPSVKLLTTGGNIRFNPNLYENGKVCLSILGTWPGPGWKNIMNLRSVLLSIQSLLNEFPIKNEPGYEDIKSDDIISITYNKYLTYYNFKIAIISILKEFSKDNPEKSQFYIFKKEIIEETKKNYKYLSNDLKSYKLINGIFEVVKCIYFIRSKMILDFFKLESEFSEIMPLFSKKNELNLI
tara:strand:+ start:1815 stop:2555 length:741 start_codon:yes stop_codon:yes gene_type:complete